MTIKSFHHQLLAALVFFAGAFFLFAPAAGNSSQAAPVDATVQHLIAYVATSDMTFIRNSGKYSAQEASAHMQKKYEHFRDDISTPEDFIELCATRSLLTGKPYMVVNAQGEKIRTSEWLTAELAVYRNSRAGETD